MKLNAAAMFMPEWLTVWFLVAAAGAAIFGFRRSAVTLAAIPFIDWFVVPLVVPYLDMVPSWVLLAVIGVIALATLNSLLVILLGKEAAGMVVGTYFVRLFDFLLLSPFRLVRAIRRAILG